jgi:hypothetical protein
MDQTVISSVHDRIDLEGCNIRFDDFDRCVIDLHIFMSSPRAGDSLYVIASPVF